MMTTTPSTPSGAAPPATPQKLSLEEELRKEFTAVVTDIETTQFEGKFRFVNREGMLDSYFTTVIPYHAKPKQAVRQFAAQQGGYLNQFLSESWEEKEKDFYDEGREAVQLFFERFPVVQSHLPLGYSKRWAEDRLGDLREYLHNKREAKSGWDQAKAHQELLQGFKDDKKIQRYNDQHRSRQGLVKGVGIAAAALALAGMGFYFHNREGRVGELEAENGKLKQSVGTLTDSNTTLNDEKNSLTSQVTTLTGERNALNSQYDAISSAVGSNDVAALKQAVCRYLDTVNGDVVFKQTAQNSALRQLFAALVGPQGGRTDYESLRQGFVHRLKPVFPTADPSGYYQFFTNEDCTRSPK